MAGQPASQPWVAAIRYARPMAIESAMYSCWVMTDSGRERCGREVPSGIARLRRGLV
ncbi:MAG: hypothetical protein AAGB51_10920 [Planctomycetota bacterium]